MQIKNPFKTNTESVESSEKDVLPSPATAAPKEPLGQRFKRAGTGFYKMFFTRKGLIGDKGEVDYAYLFTPPIPFIGKEGAPPVFYGLNDKMPILLAAILGLQHAMAMMGGLISAALVFASAAHLDTATTTYLVSASLIGTGILSLIQIIRFRIPFTNYHVGTGMVSVLGVSFATVPVFQTALGVMYNNGYCPVDADGTKLACPDAYGAFLATSSICALFEVLFAFSPQKIILKLFPPIVNGPVVLLIGADLIHSGMTDWAGGAACTTPGSLCPSATAPHAHPWGSGQFIGLGFSVFVAITVCDKWGAPFMKSCSIIVGLLVGCIIAAACGYFQHEPIDASPNGQFLWVHTFRLKLYGPIVLPLLAVYMVCIMESVGDITATSDVSRLEVEGPIYESRVQGGILGSGLASVLGGLFTLCPMASFAQNNGVIAMTQCASRITGLFACFWLIIMGVIGKFSAAIVQIPKPVLGGMTTFLFTQVAVSGIRIISTIKFTRRDRVVLTSGLMFGLAGLLVPNWFDRVITYDGNNTGKKGFCDAINIVVSTGPAICGFVCVFFNLFFPQVEDFNPYEAPVVEENTSENSLEPHGSLTRIAEGEQTYSKQ